jgi:type II secretory pathway pseudopilin PulG
MKGISLVETLVTIGIFGVIIVIVSGIVLSLYKTQNYSWQQSLAIDEARRGVRIMVKEIREARYGDNGAFLLEKAGDKEFVFYSDIDEDGDTEKVRYFLGIVNSGSQTQIIFYRGIFRWPL